MTKGVDTATPVSAGQAGALHAAGKSFVARYLSTPGNPKNITAAEARRLHQAELDVVLVYETVAGRALAGSEAGRSDAVSARAQAKLAGWTDPVIYFAFDQDPNPLSPAMFDVLVGYYRGVAAELGAGHSGPYGGIRLVKAVLDAGICHYAWQTSAWSAGRLDPRAQLHQVENGVTVGGLTVDLDDALHPAYGQWPHPKAKTYRWRVRGDGLHIIGHAQRRITWIGRHPSKWRRQRERSGFERIHGGK